MYIDARGVFRKIWGCQPNLDVVNYFEKGNPLEIFGNQNSGRGRGSTVPLYDGGGGGAAVALNA